MGNGTSNDTSKDERFTRYLLGDLTEEERVQIEEEYFTDDASFERYLTVKDELVDAYARHELKGPTLERFEKHFLSTLPRRERARAAKDLIELTTAASRSHTALAQHRHHSPWSTLFSRLGGPSPAKRFALTAAVLVAIVGGIWLIKSRTDPGAERAEVTPSPAIQAPTEREQSNNIQSQPNTNEGNPQPPPTGTTPTSSPVPSPPNINANQSTPRTPTTHIASITLTPVLTRGAGQTSTLHIGTTTKVAQLELVFAGGEYRNYIAELQTIDGKNVWQRSGFKAGRSGAGSSVIVSIPAQTLRNKDYIVTLSGLTTEGSKKVINEYFFSIKREN